MNRESGPSVDGVLSSALCSVQNEPKGVISRTEGLCGFETAGEFEGPVLCTGRAVMLWDEYDDPVDPLGLDESHGAMSLRKQHQLFLKVDRTLRPRRAVVLSVLPIGGREPRDTVQVFAEQDAGLVRVECQGTALLVFSSAVATSAWSFWEATS